MREKCTSLHTTFSSLFPSLISFLFQLLFFRCFKIHESCDRSCSLSLSIFFQGFLPQMSIVLSLSLPNCVRGFYVYLIHCSLFLLLLILLVCIVLVSYNLLLFFAFTSFFPFLLYFYSEFSLDFNHFLACSLFTTFVCMSSVPNVAKLHLCSFFYSQIHRFPDSVF